MNHKLERWSRAVASMETIDMDSWTHCATSILPRLWPNNWTLKTDKYECTQARLYESEGSTLGDVAKFFDLSLRDADRLISTLGYGRNVQPYQVGAVICPK